MATRTAAAVLAIIGLLALAAGVLAGGRATVQPSSTPAPASPRMSAGELDDLVAFLLPTPRQR